MHVETIKAIEKSNKTQIWFFENIHGTDKSLVRSAKQREDTNDEQTGRGNACQHCNSNRMP